MPVKKIIRKVIWTRSYNPWVLGGNPHAPIGCEVSGFEVSLGRGFRGFVTTSPKGRIIVAELETGAIVGYSVEQVKEDIQTGGSVAGMKQQIQNAKALMRDLHVVSPEKFWSRYDKET
jgi:hypothetical protein